MVLLVGIVGVEMRRLHRSRHIPSKRPHSRSHPAGLNFFTTCWLWDVQKFHQMNYDPGKQTFSIISMVINFDVENGGFKHVSRRYFDSIYNAWVSERLNGEAQHWDISDFFKPNLIEKLSFLWEIEKIWKFCRLLSTHLHQVRNSSSAANKNWLFCHKYFSKWFRSHWHVNFFALIVFHVVLWVRTCLCLPSLFTEGQMIVWPQSSQDQQSLTNKSGWSYCPIILLALKINFGKRKMLQLSTRPKKYFLPQK